MLACVLVSILYFLNFTFNIVYIIERDVHLCGALIKLGARRYGGRRVVQVFQVFSHVSTGEVIKGVLLAVKPH